MKIVLAFEGMDGAGKTSLAVFARRLCEERGLRLALVTRRESYSSPLVGRLTRLLHDEGPSLLPQADTFIRIAREYQRAALAVQAPADIIILDRFVLSLLALARFHGVDRDGLVPVLKDLTARAHLHATVFVHCPFETARARVEERSASQPGKKSRDDRFLRRFGELLEEEFGRGALTGQQWPVDNGSALTQAEDQLAGYLRPYLQLADPRPAPLPKG